MVTCGYKYDNNFFRVKDHDAVFEIWHRVINESCKDCSLPNENELYYTLYGEPELGFICTEPWIGGINSLNTGKGMVKIRPGGIFKWQITIRWTKTL